MGKDKLKRFAENLTFKNLLQPMVVYPPADDPIKGNWGEVFFRNNNPIILELGCGRGEYTINLAEKFPDKNFIGIDWKGARLWRGAKTGVENKMANVGFLRIQIQVINSFFAENEVDEIWITFPVPHMLKTDERKRMTSPRFLDSYRKLMTRDGIVHLKTDSRELYDYSTEIVKEQNLQINKSSSDIYSDYNDDEILSIKTTYEKLWLKEGAKICYLSFKING